MMVQEAEGVSETRVGGRYASAMGGLECLQEAGSWCERAGGGANHGGEAALFALAGRRRLRGLCRSGRLLCYPPLLWTLSGRRPRGYRGREERTGQEGWNGRGRQAGFGQTICLPACSGCRQPIDPTPGAAAPLNRALPDWLEIPSLAPSRSPMCQPPIPGSPRPSISRRTAGYNSK